MNAEEIFIDRLYSLLWGASKSKVDKVMLQFKKAKEEFAIDFAKFIGDRPIPEYSKSTDKWRWWDNNSREYKYSTTNELLTEWGKTNKK